jgi:uncharacterized protein
MTVINTSPTIHLHAVLPGGIGALPELIGEVAVPNEVLEELAAGKAVDATWREIQGVSGIVIRDRLASIYPLIRSQIDLGEAAVIQTALNHGRATVILDDLKARRIAKTLGLEFTGTLGILLQAKQSGILDSVSETISKLDKRGMWISPALTAKAIHLAGEAST